MSLKEIAEMTGTSVSTVSKVLNDTYGNCASPGLKEKIWAAAHATGYIPNKNARDLKKGITGQNEPKKIYIVTARVGSFDEDLFFKELYQKLEIALFKEGFLLGGVLKAQQIDEAEIGEKDGVIVMGRSSERLIKALQGKTGNIVGIWRNTMDFAIDEIVCDGRKAAKMALSYLYGLGHRNIGYIGDCSYESRYVGYTEAMIGLDLAIDYNYIVPTDQSTQAGEKAMQKLLSATDLSAVLCANDMTAAGVLKTLAGQPRKGKKTISVISIDDTELAQETRPMLTTVHIPRGEMAHMAVRILSDRMDQGHSQPLKVEFPCKIVVRESCCKKE